MQDKHAGKRLRLWLWTAVTAGLGHYAGSGYMASALAAGAMLPLTLLTGEGLRRSGKAAALVQWLWAAAVLAHLLPAAGDYWPSEGSALAVPLVLLGLAALSGTEERTARICSTLFWPAALMLLGILAAAIGKIRVEWLAPRPESWSAELIVILLLPGLAATFGELPGKGISTVTILATVAAGLGAVLQGNLSPAVATSHKAPFYELGRSISGVGFEPLAAVAMTFGWYCLTCLLFRSAVSFLEKWGISPGYGKLITLGTCGTLLKMGLRINGRALVGLSLVLWILAPMLRKK